MKSKNVMKESIDFSTMDYSDLIGVRFSLEVCKDGNVCYVGVGDEDLQARVLALAAFWNRDVRFVLQAASYAFEKTSQDIREAEIEQEKKLLEEENAKIRERRKASKIELKKKLGLLA